jgi:hypothetical protein
MGLRSTAGACKVVRRGAAETTGGDKYEVFQHTADFHSGGRVARTIVTNANQ